MPIQPQSHAITFPDIQANKCKEKTLKVLSMSMSDIEQMIPYSRGIILDKTNNYGIVKTETLFGFGPRNNYANSTEPLEWIFNGSFGKSLSDNPESSRALKKTLKTSVKPSKPSSKKKQNKKLGKKHKRKSKGVKKCIFKILNKGENKKRRGQQQNKIKMNKMNKKFMMPVILGLLAAKSLLIPVALKFLAFIAAKGLMMGFFSTVMASILSLKGMFEHSHGYQNRKDDTKTQVEIIQVPTKSEDHVYYDDHYRRGDFIPIIPNLSVEQKLSKKNL